LPMGMNGMGSPIIISPVMTQNVGDVSATSHDAADHKLVEETPRPPQRPASSEEDADKDVEILAESHHQIVPRPSESTVATHDQDKDIILAETREKLRSMKLLLKAAEDGVDREKQKYATLLLAAEEGFTRERSEFNRERENMKMLYENALKSKEQSRLDTVKQLADLHELIKTKLFNIEMNHVNQDDNLSGQENSQESSLLRANVRRSRRSFT